MISRGLCNLGRPRHFWAGRYGSSSPHSFSERSVEYLLLSMLQSVASGRHLFQTVSLGYSRSLGVTSLLPRADGARERGILSVGNYDVDVLGRNVVLPPAVEKVAACNQVLLKALFVVAHRQRNRFAFDWYVTDRSYLILVKDLTVRVPVLESDVGTHASRFRFHTPQCTPTRPLRCAPVLPLPLWSAFFTRSPSLVPDFKI